MLIFPVTSATIRANSVISAHSSAQCVNSGYVSPLVLLLATHSKVIFTAQGPQSSSSTKSLFAKRMTAIASFRGRHEHFSILSTVRMSITFEQLLPTGSVSLFLVNFFSLDLLYQIGIR